MSSFWLHFGEHSTVFVLRRGFTDAALVKVEAVYNSLQTEVERA